jgi:hypothetical protein
VDSEEPAEAQSPTPPAIAPEPSAEPLADSGWLANPVYMILAVAVFAVLVGVTLAIIRNRDDGGTLAATRMTLELSYPLSDDPTAVMDGQPGTAPTGALITCRTVAQPHLRLGEGTAGEDGSFRVQLDPSPWPLESLGGDLYNQLNSSVECRAGTGDWVRPLRPPRVSVA